MLISMLLLMAGATDATPHDPPPFDMAAYFAGTLQIEQLGEVDRMLVEPSGRYEMYGVRIPEADGNWWFEKDQFCILPDPQPGVVTSPFCMNLPGRKVGDTWTQTFGDVTVTYTLLAGRA